MSRLLFAFVSLCLLLTSSNAGVSNAVITHHKGKFGGKSVKYDAFVEPILVNDSSGKPGARLVTISYVASDSKAATRPVLFVFNGGPITASSTLHMGALGPKRVDIPDDLTADPSSFRTVDNTDTLLDVADLVFFDPAGTGFSRVEPGVDPASYFSVTADGQQLAELVIEWSRLHHRESAPKYLFGESYGTLRAAATANQLQKRSPAYPLAGVALMGQALNIIEFSQRPANVTSYIVSLPTLAAIAWSHGKARTHGQSFDQFMDEVQKFGRTEYLTALFQGSSLDSVTRERVALKLEDYTGIPRSFYVANALKISKERYRRELLKDQHLLLGMIDGRYARPDDPQSKEDPAMAIYKSYQSAFLKYLHEDLGVTDSHDYVPAVSPKDELEGWRWDGTGTHPFGDWPYMNLLTEVFNSNAQFRLMIGNGWQDTQTTVGAALLARDQSGWPSDRVSVHFYQGGHMAYSVGASRKQLADDLRAFLGAGQIRTAAPSQAPSGVQYLRTADSKAPFSPAVRVGDVLYLSGQIGIGPDGKLPADFAQQTRQTIENMRGVLQRAGSSLDDVFKCTAMLSDMTRWSEFNQIYLSYFRPERLPARSTVGVSGLAYGAMLELECAAYNPVG